VAGLVERAGEGVREPDIARLRSAALWHAGIATSTLI